MEKRFLDFIPLKTWDLEVVKQIGTGAYGDVFIVKSPQYTKEIVAKIFKPIKKDAVLKQIALKEYNIGSYISENCEGTLEYYEIFESNYERKRVYVIVMEYFNGHTLHQYVRCSESSHYTIPPEMLIVFMRHILKVLTCMHSLNYAHGDLTTKNILFGKDELKVIDYGGSCKIKDESSLRCRTVITALDYRHPSLKGSVIIPDDKKEYMLKADMWSFACVCLKLIHPKIFIEKKKLGADKTVIDIFPQVFKEYEERFPQYDLKELKKIFTLCLNLDIAKIISSEETSEMLDYYYS